MENTNEPNNMPDNNNAEGAAAPVNDTPSPSLAQNKIVMGAVLFVALLATVGVFFILQSDALDVAQFEKDEAVLNEISTDLNALSGDEALLNEIEETFGDILDEIAGIPIEEALNISSIDAEASQVDLSGTLDAFDADNALLQELDQTFDEVSQ